jgi:hypothetical protein
VELQKRLWEGNIALAHKITLSPSCEPRLRSVLQVPAFKMIFTRTAICFRSL